MKVSLNFLKTITKVDLTPNELVAKIGAQLGAVEEVIDMRGKYDGVKVVQIIEAKPHENADRLNVYQITDGREQIQVVSGDKNLNVGDKVAWLAPGTTIPSTVGSAQPVVMGSRDMRGQLSYGMFGSGKELELNEDDSSVLKLDTDAKPGTLLADAYELDDVIIDIENKMFTHRPDCFGLLGVAREIAGIQGYDFASPDWYLLEQGELLKPQTEVAKLTIDNQIPMLCPQYHAVVMRNVCLGPSSIQLQSYLKRVGIRPINNIVDITNVLMYLTGQPLHAFDYDKVAAVDGQKTAAITVRLPKKGETLELLDGRVIELHKETIVIASRHKAIALGGMMGGVETEIDENTTTIIIESATFDMYAIRRSSMEHGIFTDAVTRFSKGQSQAQTRVVLARAVELVQELAEGSLATELGIEPPERPEPIETTVQFINERLGSSLHAAQIKTLLGHLEMVTKIQGGHLIVTPPFWRTDLEIPEDVVEDLGRLVGYASLPHDLPVRSTEAVNLPSIEGLKTAIRNTLATAGNNELQTYSFVPAKLLEKTDQDTAAAYRIRNAISPELELIRTSLLPSLIDKVHANHKAGFESFGLFEIGKSHNKHEIGDDHLPRERLGLSYLFSADRKAMNAFAGAAYYQAKKQLDYLFAELRITNYRYVPLHHAAIDAWWLQNLLPLFEPKRSALVIVDDQVLGIIGELRGRIKQQFKLPAYVAGFELDLALLNGLSRPVSTYQPLLRFPATEQDICLRVANDVSYGELEQAIRSCFIADERLQVTIKPLDIYQREDDTAHKQITYRILLQHHDRTLVTTEVNDLMQTVAETAAKKFAAERV